MRKLVWWVISFVLTAVVMLGALCLTPFFVLGKGVFVYAHIWSDAIIDYIAGGPSSGKKG